MAYRHHDRIRFHHTDAAGVAYFATVLALCHVAYEEALAQFGIPLSLHFSAQGDEILPITSAQIDFRRPLYCGDPYWVDVQPQLTSPEGFTLHYQVYLQTSGILTAVASTQHLCLHPLTRQKQALSPALRDWIQQTNQPPSPPAKGS